MGKRRSASLALRQSSPEAARLSKCRDYVLYRCRIFDCKVMTPLVNLEEYTSEQQSSEGNTQYGDSPHSITSLQLPQNIKDIVEYTSLS